MFFWIFVTIIVLCIGYRKEISAKFDRKIYNLIKSLQYEDFQIMFNPDCDADIIKYLAYIQLLNRYLIELIEVDIGKISLQEFAERNPQKRIFYNTPKSLEHINLHIDREYHIDVINKLKKLVIDRTVYLRRLVREDIKYRKDMGMFINPYVIN